MENIPAGQDSQQDAPHAAPDVGLNITDTLSSLATTLPFTNLAGQASDHPPVTDGGDAGPQRLDHVSDMLESLSSAFPVFATATANPSIADGPRASSGGLSGIGSQLLQLHQQFRSDPPDAGPQADSKPLGAAAAIAAALKRATPQEVSQPDAPDFTLLSETVSESMHQTHADPPKPTAAPPSAPLEATIPPVPMQLHDPRPPTGPPVVLPPPPGPPRLIHHQHPPTRPAEPPSAPPPASLPGPPMQMPRPDAQTQFTQFPGHNAGMGQAQMNAPAMASKDPVRSSAGKGMPAAGPPPGASSSAGPPKLPVAHPGAGAPSVGRGTAPPFAAAARRPAAHSHRPLHPQPPRTVANSETSAPGTKDSGNAQPGAVKVPENQPPRTVVHPHNPLKRVTTAAAAALRKTAGSAATNERQQTSKSLQPSVAGARKPEKLTLGGQSSSEKPGTSTQGRSLPATGRQHLKQHAPSSSSRPTQPAGDGRDASHNRHTVPNKVRPPSQSQAVGDRRLMASAGSKRKQPENVHDAPSAGGLQAPAARPSGTLQLKRPRPGSGAGNGAVPVRPDDAPLSLGAAHQVSAEPEAGENRSMPQVHSKTIDFRAATGKEGGARPLKRKAEKVKKKRTAGLEGRGVWSSAAAAPRGASGQQIKKREGASADGVIAKSSGNGRVKQGLRLFSDSDSDDQASVDRSGDANLRERPGLGHAGKSDVVIPRHKGPDRPSSAVQRVAQDAHTGSALGAGNEGRGQDHAQRSPELRGQTNSTTAAARPKKTSKALPQKLQQKEGAVFQRIFPSGQNAAGAAAAREPRITMHDVEVQTEATDVRESSVQTPPVWGRSSGCQTDPEPAAGGKAVLQSGVPRTFVSAGVQCRLGDIDEQGSMQERVAAAMQAVWSVQNVKMFATAEQWEELKRHERAMTAVLTAVLRGAQADGGAREEKSGFEERGNDTDIEHAVSQGNEMESDSDDEELQQQEEMLDQGEHAGQHMETSDVRGQEDEQRSDGGYESEQQDERAERGQSSGRNTPDFVDGDADEGARDRHEEAWSPDEVVMVPAAPVLEDSSVPAAAYDPPEVESDDEAPLNFRTGGDMQSVPQQDGWGQKGISVNDAVSAGAQERGGNALSNDGRVSEASDSDAAVPSRDNEAVKAAIRMKLRALLPKANLEVTTTKSVRRRLEMDLRRDLKEYADFIRDTIDEFLENGRRFAKMTPEEAAEAQRLQRVSVMQPQRSDWDSTVPTAAAGQIVQQVGHQGMATDGGLNEDSPCGNGASGGATARVQGSGAGGQRDEADAEGGKGAARMNLVGRLNGPISAAPKRKGGATLYCPTGKSARERFRNTMSAEQLEDAKRAAKAVMG